MWLKYIRLSQVRWDDMHPRHVLIQCSPRPGLQSCVQHGADASGERQEDHRAVRRDEGHDQGLSTVSTLPCQSGTVLNPHVPD